MWVHPWVRRSWLLNHVTAVILVAIYVSGRRTVFSLSCDRHMQNSAGTLLPCLVPDSSSSTNRCVGIRGDDTTDDICRAQKEPNTRLPTLHLAFVVTGNPDTALVDTALRSLLYYRTCPVHIHLVEDDATDTIDWDWLGWFPEVQHSTYVTHYNRGFDQSVLKPSTYEHWGTGTTPWGEKYAWAREVIPSRFAKLSLDAILPQGIEEVLFADNDVVFLDDVCKAHDVFASMPRTAVFGMSPQMSDLYTHVQAPYAFPVKASERWQDQPGINSGVIFWKLERARQMCWSPSFSEPRPQHCLRRWDWLQFLESGIAQYNFGLLDQDIFNYAGWLHPEWVHVSLPFASCSCTKNMQFCFASDSPCRCMISMQMYDQHAVLAFAYICNTLTEPSAMLLAALLDYHNVSLDMDDA